MEANEEVRGPAMGATGVSASPRSGLGRTCHPTPCPVQSCPVPVPSAPSSHSSCLSRLSCRLAFQAHTPPHTPFQNSHLNSCLIVQLSPTFGGLSPATLTTYHTSRSSHTSHPCHLPRPLLSTPVMCCAVVSSRPALLSLCLSHSRLDVQAVASLDAPPSLAPPEDAHSLVHSSGPVVCKHTLSPSECRARADAIRGHCSARTLVIVKPFPRPRNSLES